MKKVYQLENIRKIISPDLKDFLKSMSTNFEFCIGGKKIKLMHGGPSNFLNEYIYPNSDFLKFNQMPYDFFFMGHTHYPFIKFYNGKTIVNIGSCGMPRDHGTLSSFAVLDTEFWDVKILRIPMDTLTIKELYSSSTHQSVIELHERQPNQFTGILIQD
jgi:predicted phosphodiesterase